ncbi:MAG: ABC transporter ATP-binding protein [Gemmatimonadota bacterium]|nr:MAG: ABC transporter ATP-binding protein [Gemmatimonadota bacterium]
MSELLRVRHLTTSFMTGAGLARAVDDVSLTLLEGETLGMVGESGCGKTVTALSLLRLVDRPGHIAHESVIEYQGKDLMQMSPAQLRQIRGAEIAMIFQEPTASLNPVLTVGAQVDEAVRAHRSVSRADARARTVELFELVGIPDPAKRVNEYPHQLSGGMQQRAMIAMALSCNPRILIADEPTTALDVTIQAQILELLVELKQRLGMAMILITHDLGIVAGVADRVAVMYGGQIVEQANTDALFRQPAHPYTSALLRAVPRLDQPATRLATIPGAVPPATAWPPACRFHPRCPQTMDHCKSEMPGLTETGPAHLTRCWLAEEQHRRDA